MAEVTGWRLLIVTIALAIAKIPRITKNINVRFNLVTHSNLK